MNPPFSEAELGILRLLDGLVKQDSARSRIEPIVAQVERKLDYQPEALLTWEPIPLGVYGAGLPPHIRSSWVFVLRARVETGAERHPNSHQRVMSYLGLGDLQTHSGGR